MITMEVGKPSSQSQVIFQLDTGSKCNILLLKDYRPVNGDVDLKPIYRYPHMFLKTYTNVRYRIKWSHKKRYVLLFYIIEDDLAPLLLYSTCIELGLVTINDCDSTMVSNSSGFELISGIAATTGLGYFPFR